MNNSLIPFTKVWNDRDGNYGEKKYWFNPALEIKGMEGCKIKRNGRKDIECTKIFYPDGSFVILLGSEESFIEICQEAGTAICLLDDLRKEGLTIKDFLKQMSIFGNPDAM